MKRLRILSALLPVFAGLICARQAQAAPAAALTLTVTPATFASTAGANAATGTVTRAATAGALVVTLKSGDTSLARVPASVTIPASAPSATFPVSAVASNVVRGTRQLHISASAPGYTTARVQIHVTDAAKASLRMVIRPRRFAENAGPNAAIGEVTRNAVAEDIRQPLVVTLASTDTSEARVPANVTIPAGQQSARFTVSAVANTANRPHGMTTLHITASAPGYAPATDTIVVTDVRTTRPAPATKTVTTTTTTVTKATLGLVVAPATVASTAGATAATATVTRAPVANTALVVTLRSTDTSLARVPAAVTIPAGQAAATFPVSAVVNPALKGRNKGVHITATAAGFPTATVGLTVTH